MILTVTANPAIDLTFRVDGLLVGESNRVPTARSRSGGKGLNVARVAHQLGHDVLALATVGGDTGVEFARGLVGRPLPHLLVPVSAATRRSIALVDSGNEATTVLNETGSPLAEREWQALTAAVRAQVGAATCLVGSGSLPPGAPDGFYAELVQIAHGAGVPAIIDATGDVLLAAVRAGADLVKPNRRELVETTGQADPLAAALSLLDAGARMVLVSLGEDGMFAVSTGDRTPLFARLPRCAGNPTGAGDAAVAAAAVCLTAGDDDPEAILRRACAWSAAAVLAPLAGEVAGDVRALEAAVTLSRSTASPPVG
ncbi:1-phosphofructokinase family hexose kinase [Parafrigoribacterium mesophilum]|uniref:1-phosphofructokinase family hexose kinase n=1 Tax=Parafrigoribacterium mesophilum TaxID=433646 RepID=UPI0031FDC9AE